MNTRKLPAPYADELFSYYLWRVTQSLGTADPLLPALAAERFIEASKHPTYRARIAELIDDPPELGERCAAYCRRMVDKYGTPYHPAAAERWRTVKAGESRAGRTAAALLDWCRLGGKRGAP